MTQARFGWITLTALARIRDVGEPESPYRTGWEGISTFTTAVPDWKVGDEFFTADRTRFRIEDIVRAMEIGEFTGMFVLTPVELAEPD